ncbi:GEVED domain-containing protein, partial [Aequorivita sp. F47161]
MKKFTMLILLLAFSVSFSYGQQPMIKTNGTDNPIHFNQQQKKQAVTPSNISINSDANIQQKGENNPVVYKNQTNSPQDLNLLQGNRSNHNAQISSEGANNPISGMRNGSSYSPLFLSIEARDQAEILAAEQEGVNPNLSYTPVVQNRGPLSDIIPSAGATETFAVVPGDFFYDPSDGVTGGPGGDCSTTSSGNTGDYPNCDCDTVTTLTGAGLSVEFLSFRVFGTFDYLNIYDGPDTSSPQIYDSNLNADTDTLAGMIAANGSAVFTSTTGALTFEFHATGVVNTCGWEVEVLSGGGGAFPAPYCGPLEFNSGVEPITLVEVAGISNVSDPVIDGSPAHEDFTAISGDMEEGMTYPIALEGNTGGGFTNSFTVFIDWNQDGILDNASERYEIGTITGSTGTDGQQATNDILVPAGVTAGPTRMRVIKKFLASYAPDSCTPGSGFGQAEDYTINVTTGGGGGGGVCSEENPNDFTFENGFNCSSASAFMTANDVTVAADTDFTLSNITA